MIWLFCAVASGLCFEWTYPSKEACIQAEKAAFHRLGLADPFETNLAYCRPVEPTS